LSKRAESTSNTLNTLVVQKQRLKRIAVDYLYSALFMLLVDIVVLIVALTLKDKVHANRILYIAIPILSVLCAVFLFFSIKRFLLLNAFKSARFDSERAIKIDCKSVRFITHPEKRTFIVIICIIFVDINGQKYVYVLPEESVDSKTAREKVRQLCEGKAVELICYDDTKMVKHCDILS